MLTERLARRLGVHVDVVRLGLVSLLTDLSSEMIFSVFAIFFTTIAGASAALLGAVEGAADFAASALDYVSGWLSDRSGRRRSFAILGYGFSTLAKLMLLVTTSVAGLGAFRVVERLGKSLRGPPRDAWLAAVAAGPTRGLAFGVHKALDKTGAVLGPLVAYFLITRYGSVASTYRLLFWIALVPAALAVLMLFLIQDRPAPPKPRLPVLSVLRQLSPQFRRYLWPAGIFALGYFGFAFLLLQAYRVGFTVSDIVLLYALFNVSFVIAAPLIGRIGDRVGRGPVIVAGYVVYGLLCLGFAYATARWEVIVLFALYGVFYSIDEAQTKAFIADMEQERRASAMGIYNFLTGMLYVPASLGAGALWVYGPAYAFLAAAMLSVIAILTFLWIRPDQPRTHHP